MSGENGEVSTGDEEEGAGVAAPPSPKRQRGDDEAADEGGEAAEAAAEEEAGAADGRRRQGSGRWRKTRYDRPPSDGFAYESRSVVSRSNRTAACSFPCVTDGCSALRSVIWTAQGRIRECEVSPAHNHPPVAPLEQPAAAGPERGADRNPEGTGGGGD